MPSPKLQQRCATFVDWIATEPSKIDEIQRQATDVRAAIKAQATEDGLVVRSEPDPSSRVSPARRGNRHGEFRVLPPTV